MTRKDAGGGWRAWFGETFGVSRLACAARFFENGRLVNSAKGAHIAGCGAARGVSGNRDKGSFAEAYRCVLFDGDCAGKCHALVQRGARRAGRRYRAGGRGYPAADGGGVAAISEGLLFATAGRGWFADRRIGELAGRGFPEGRVRAGQRSTGEPASGAAGLAVRC